MSLGLLSSCYQTPKVIEFNTSLSFPPPPPRHLYYTFCKLQTNRMRNLSLEIASREQNKGCPAAANADCPCLHATAAVLYDCLFSFYQKKPRGIKTAGGRSLHLLKVICVDSCPYSCVVCTTSNRGRTRKTKTGDSGESWWYPCGLLHSLVSPRTIYVPAGCVCSSRYLLLVFLTRRILHGVTPHAVDHKHIPLLGRTMCFLQVVQHTRLFGGAYDFAQEPRPQRRRLESARPIKEPRRFLCLLCFC